jgi:hypothetical protein
MKLTTFQDYTSLSHMKNLGRAKLPPFRLAVFARATPTRCASLDSKRVLRAPNRFRGGLDWMAIPTRCLLEYISLLLVGDRWCPYVRKPSYVKKSQTTIDQKPFVPILASYIRNRLRKKIGTSTQIDPKKSAT